MSTEHSGWSPTITNTNGQASQGLSGSYVRCHLAFSPNRRYTWKVTGVTQLSLDFSYSGNLQNMFSNPSIWLSHWGRASHLLMDLIVGPPRSMKLFHLVSQTRVWGVQGLENDGESQLLLLLYLFLECVAMPMMLQSWSKAHPDPFFSFLPLTSSSISRLLFTGVIISCLIRLLVSYTSIPQNILQDLLYVRWESSPGEGPQEETRTPLRESSLPKWS